MTQVRIDSSVEWNYWLSDTYGVQVEVSDETAERWQRVQAEHDQMVSEMLEALDKASQL